LLNISNAFELIIFAEEVSFCGDGGTVSTLIDPYRISTPFQIIRNKFLIINEKLFDSRMQCVQTHCSSRTETKNTLQKQSIFNFVEMSRNTLNPLKNYLSKFWVYYNSSLNLQKALENA